MSRTRACTALVLVAIGLILTTSAHAAGTLKLSPAFTDIVVDRDHDKTVTFDLTNTSGQIVELEMSGLDFREHEGGTISFEGEQSGNFSYSLASFLTLESSSVVLKPHETKHYQVTIKNRTDLSPGGHYAALVARIKDSAQVRQGAEVAPAVTGLILLRKEGGERYNLSLIQTDWPDRPIAFSVPNAIQLTFQNEGNVHLIPYGTVEVRDMFGRLTHRGVINPSSLRIFPESKRYIHVDMMPVDVTLPISLDTYHVRGSDSLNKVHYKYDEIYVYIDPMLIVLLIGIVVILWNLRRRKKATKNS